VVFTSGATEADNLAILGCALAAKGGRIVTVATEHKAVLAACDAAEARGFSVSRIRPDATGVIDPQVVAREITNDTLLVSVMHVNNETGVIQDIEAIGHIARRAGALFHVDAAQSVGKIRLDLSSLPVDLMSISGHKIYGPKGIGALFHSTFRSKAYSPNHVRGWTRGRTAAWHARHPSNRWARRGNIRCACQI
jgi:cysteine desulfurase